MRPTDPRHANRRGQTAWGDNLGIDPPPEVLEQTPVARLPHHVKRPAAPFYPDVNEYFYGGIVMARCAKHAPPGAQLYTANVYGAYSRCVTCVTPPVAEPVPEDA